MFAKNNDPVAEIAERASNGLIGKRNREDDSQAVNQPEPAKEIPKEDNLPAVVENTVDCNVIAVGSWGKDSLIKQINIDAPLLLRDQLDSAGEGTKNIKLSYFFALGLACSKLINDEDQLEVTERKLMRLIERLNDDPSYILKLIDS